MHSRGLDLVGHRGSRATSACPSPPRWRSSPARPLDTATRSAYARAALAPRRPRAPEGAAAGGGDRAAAGPRVIRNRRIAAKPMTVGGGGAGGGREPGRGRRVPRRHHGPDQPCSTGARTATWASSTRRPEDARQGEEAVAFAAEARAPPGGPRGRDRTRARAARSRGRAGAAAGRGPGRARPRGDPLARAASGARPHRLHRLHPVRPRADPGRERARLPAQALRGAAGVRAAPARLLPRLLLRGDEGAGAAGGADRGGGSARHPHPGHVGGVDALHQGALRVPRGAPGPPPAPALGADGRLRPGRAHRGGERDRQVGVRAGPDRPRPPAGGGRRGGDPPHRRPPHRVLARPDALPHGAARPRRHQHQGPLRRVLDPHLPARRAGGEPGALGGGTGVRSARPPGREVPDPRPGDALDPHAGGAGEEPRHTGGGGRPQPALEGARLRCGAPVRRARGRDDREAAPPCRRCGGRRLARDRRGTR